MIVISRTGRVLRRLVRLSCRSPILTVAVSLALAVLGAGYTLYALAFRTSTLDLLPSGMPYVERYREYGREFGELEDIVVVVEAPTFEAAKAYAARVVQELRESPIKFERAAYRVDPKRFEGRQLLYLSLPELREIRNTVVDRQEFMESFVADPSLAQLVEGINEQLASALVSSFLDLGLDDGKPRTDTRFLSILVDQMTTRLERPMPYRSPWGTLFSIGSQNEADAGYFTSEDRSLLFILVETPESDKGSFLGNQKAIGAVREVVSRLRSDFPQVSAGVTGRPALSNDEMTAAFHDSQIASILAFGLTLLVMALAFWQVSKPLLMLLVGAVSLAWSIGITTLTIGHLTIFSVMFISIVIGVGIDYGIYFLFRYEEESFLGLGVREALERTAARSGPGMLLGALTAAATFYVLTLTDFRGIRELGFIAGTAILLAWLSMMTLLPAALMLVDRARAAALVGQETRAHRLERVRVPWFERVTRWPRTVFVAAGVATMVSAMALPSVTFDYNLLNLQAAGTESVLWEKRTLAATGRSGFNGLASARSLAELRQKQEAFEKLPSVSEVDSVVRIIPDAQPEKIEIIRSLAPLVGPVRVGRWNPVDLDRLQRALRDLKRRLDVAAAEAGDKLPADIQEVRPKVDRLIAQLRRGNRDLAESALSHLQSQLYRDFVDQFHSLQRNLEPREISVADIPDELRRKFIGRNGSFLLQIHPKVDIWEREGARAFVRDLRSVDPEVTGSPVITYEAITLMERAYFQGTVYAFAVVALLIFAMIRRVRETFLALLPLATGVLWTVGLMHLFGLKFTFANVWGLPLIIGASAEFGLNLVLRYMEGRRHGGPLVARSTVMAVVLNGITTMVGFGSLMVATHRGIFGLGLLLTLGTACALAASLLVLPAILALLTRTAARPARAAARSGSTAA
jgi:hopanoid biosynthesis associated RND transporter like protein HpnN